MIKDVTEDTKIYKLVDGCEIRLKVKKIMDYIIIVDYKGNYKYLYKDDVHLIDGKYYWV